MLQSNKLFRYIIFGGVALATFCFAYLVREVVCTFLAGGLMTYFLFRPVALLERHGIPRGWGIAIVYLLLGAITAVLLWIAVPRLLQEINEAAARLPAYAAQLQEFSGRIHDVHLPGKLDLMLQDNLDRIEKSIFALIKDMVNSIYTFFSKVLIIVFAPILAVYMIKDWEKIKAALLFILPPAARRETVILTSRIDAVWIEYLKGHLLVSALVGMATGLAAVLIGVDFALVIGIVAAITNLVPYFGPILGGIPAILLALVQSWQNGLYMAIAILLIQQLESNVLTPKIIGDKLGMHPLAVVFALLAGGKLFGIFGMLIAVPLAAALRIIISHVYLKFVE